MDMEEEEEVEEKQRTEVAERGRGGAEEKCEEGDEEEDGGKATATMTPQTTPMTFRAVANRLAVPADPRHPRHLRHPRRSNLCCMRSRSRRVRRMTRCGAAMGIAVVVAPRIHTRTLTLVLGITDQGEIVTEAVVPGVGGVGGVAGKAAREGTGAGITGMGPPVLVVAGGAGDMNGAGRGKTTV